MSTSRGDMSTYDPDGSRKHGTVRIHPATIAGDVHVPGDKSCSHRALLIGALADGGCEVAGLAPSEDVGSTADALRALGVRVDLAADAHGALVGSVEGPLRESESVIDCGNSGTTLRLLAGIVAGLPGVTVLTGDVSLRHRPVDRVVAPLGSMGATTLARGGGRYPPLVVSGGGLGAIDHESPVASAQVKSCVLLAGVAGQVPVSVTSPLPSRDHSERLLGHLGTTVARTVLEDGRERVRLEPDQPTGRPIRVLGDPSSAAVWAVAAAIGEGHAVHLPDICLNPTRTGAFRVLERMGAVIRTEPDEDVCGEPSGTLTVSGGDLGGARISGAEVVDALDELPVLAVAGALSRDGLDVRDAAELRVKESDRIASLAAALGSLGVEVEERPDGFRVPGGQVPGPGTVDAAGDHRIAMTAAVAGTVATGPVIITGFDAVITSYPTFLDDLRTLGGRADVLDGTAP